MLRVVKVIHRSEYNQVFLVNSSEVKQRSDRVFRIHFNSSESNSTVGSPVRYFILAVVK